MTLPDHGPRIRAVVHHGLDVDGYAEGMASLARWPGDRAAVLRRLAISDARWEGAAAAFRAALVDEAARGEEALAVRFRASFEAARARLDREAPDLATLAPLRVASAPQATRSPIPTPSRDRTENIDPEALRRALASASSPVAAAPATGTVEIAGPAPFVPSALPFSAVSDEEIEAYAELTSDLEVHPTRVSDVLAKHGIASDVALERERERWARRFDRDVRLQLHWDGMHRSFVGFAQRQRGRGKEPAL